MINQGFVTDSDTEKELKKWQQARATAVDEDKLKRQYKTGSTMHRGSTLKEKF